MRYKLSNEAKMDLAGIYWFGVDHFGVEQAERYYHKLIQRFTEIAENPYKYQAVEHIRQGYRRSVCGVESIYYRIQKDQIEIMRIIGRQSEV